MPSDSRPQDGSAGDLDPIRAALRKELKVEGAEQEALLEYLVTGKPPQPEDATMPAVRLGKEGATLADRGEHEEAICRYDQALELDATNAVLWGNKARSAEALGRFDDALRFYDRARELDPNLGVASHKARALMRMGRLEEALTEFDRSLAADPAHAASWHNKGAALCMLNRQDEALAAFVAALRIDPHHVAAWRNKASVLTDLGRHEEAREANTRFLEEFQPGDFPGWSRKASEALRLDRPELAVECLRRATELQPNNPEGWMRLGEVLFKQRRYEEALQACYKAAAAGHPEAEAFRDLIHKCLTVGIDEVAAEVAEARAPAGTMPAPGSASRSPGLWDRLRRWFGPRGS